MCVFLVKQVENRVQYSCRLCQRGKNKLVACRSQELLLPVRRNKTWISTHLKKKSWTSGAACRPLRLNCDVWSKLWGIQLFHLVLNKKTHSGQFGLDENKEAKNEDLHQESGSKPPSKGGKDKAALNKLNPRFYNSPASQKRKSPTAESKTTESAVRGATEGTTLQVKACKREKAAVWKRLRSI